MLSSSSTSAERYRARLGRVMDDGPPGENRIAVVMADCGLHTHAEKIVRALNQLERLRAENAELLESLRHWRGECRRP